LAVAEFFLSLDFFHNYGATVSTVICFNIFARVAKTVADKIGHLIFPLSQPARK